MFRIFSYFTFSVAVRTRVKADERLISGCMTVPSLELERVDGFKYVFEPLWSAGPPGHSKEEVPFQVANHVSTYLPLNTKK